MASSIHVSEWAQWTNGDYGDGKPEKYRFGVDADLEVVSVNKEASTAKFRLKGKMYTRCTPNGINTGPAADFAWLTTGNFFPMSSCPWTEPDKNYYGYALPFLPSNQTTTNLNHVLANFRGDTQRASAPYNRTSLWSTNGGMLESNRTTDGQVDFPIDFQWEQSIANGKETPILVWTTSGCSYSPVGYNTAYHYVHELHWVVYADFGFEHCIHYDANGGQGAPDDYCWESTDECDLYRISTQEPWSPHWVFLGWSTNKNATTPQYRPGETITVCDALTLYAVYRYTYRPGMCRHNGTWMSHDRDGVSGPEGRANIRRNGKWIEMRIDPINSGLDDPPCIMQNGAWRIQQLIGQDGVPHHIKWNCPHQWN